MPGLDGGTYITRSDVLRGQSWNVATADDSRSRRGGYVSSVYKPKTLTSAEHRNVVLSTCALSGARLTPPIVGDLLGALYNRTAVLEYVLAVRHASFSDDAAQHRYINQLREGGATYEHLTSIKDVYNVTLPDNDTFSSAPQHTPAGTTHPHGPLRCPITDAASDKCPFIALVSCGHIMSQRAVNETQGGAQEGTCCPVCGAAYDRDVDLVPLAPDKETLESLRATLQGRSDVIRRRGGKKGKRRREDDDVSKEKNKKKNIDD